jgi:hypothetical protein
MYSQISPNFENSGCREHKHHDCVDPVDHKAELPLVSVVAMACELNQHQNAVREPHCDAMINP